MTGRERLEAEEKRTRIYYRSSGRCEICEQPMPITTMQLAHRIGQTKANLKKYGKEIIHHELNMKAVCGLRCNARADISFRTEEVKALVEEIRNAEGITKGK